jgi:phenylacetate-CoA ligase
MAKSQEHYDELETRSPEERETALLQALPAQIAYARENASHFGRLLKGVDADAVSSRQALAGLPVTRKGDLIEMQKKGPPLGGFAVMSPGRIRNIYQSPGPIHEADGHGHDYWGMARAFFAGGFREGDVVHNTFSYHFTPAGAMTESGCHALGCIVFPAGIGQTEQQVEAIAAIRPTAYAGTPSFLKILLEKARETGADVSSLIKAEVGGEALPPSLRAELKEYGVAVSQLYATADLGLIAYESPAREGLIVDEDLIVEILRPGTGDPVPPGEVGEVVVTTFSKVYPLVRFGTGDLSAVMEGVSPCGRTNLRLKGWMGRADQATKVKGMFVQPAQIAEVLKRHPEIGKVRLVVDRHGGKDVMTLNCETREEGADLAARIADTLRAVAKMKGEVALVAPGSLANDGKVIDDVRDYD